MPGVRSSLRALFGPWAGDRPEPLPAVPGHWPAPLQERAQQAVRMLATYQGVAYARLYLQRLARYDGRRDVDPALLLRIADLMATRMAYQDFIRVAQQVLDGSFEAPHCRIRVDDVIESLPCVIADPMLGIAARTGGTRRLVTLRYYPSSVGGRLRLRLEAGFRHWRGLSRHARRERRWIERWLHMIDRALVRQPEAAAAIAETATMVGGYGEPYRAALMRWHLLIDNLVKPALDGTRVLPDLADTVQSLRAIEQEPTRFAARVAEIEAATQNRDRADASACKPAPAMP
jgi:hypothetical protein